MRVLYYFEYMKEKLYFLLFCLITFLQFCFYSVLIFEGYTAVFFLSLQKKTYAHFYCMCIFLIEMLRTNFNWLLYSPCGVEVYFIDIFIYRYMGGNWMNQCLRLIWFSTLYARMHLNLTFLLIGNNIYKARLFLIAEVFKLLE